MRTSTKLLVVTGLFLAGMLILYDGKLAAKYRTGEYRQRFYGYGQLNFSGFDSIELQSSSVIDLVVERGDFKVLENPQADRFITVRQDGRRLIVSANFQDHVQRVNGSPAVYISCPTLANFKADAHYLLNRSTQLDGIVGSIWWLPSYISGFWQDSLTITADHAANIKLAGNHFGKVTATLGEGKGEANSPQLTIEASNQIDSTDLRIQDQGRLTIQGKGIRRLTYTLADGASLTVDGAAAQYLNHY